MKNKVTPIKAHAAQIRPAQSPQLPETGFLRLNQIIGDDQHAAIIPIGKTTWYEGIKNGKFPKPVKLGSRTSAWRVEDIRTLVESMGAV